MPILRLVFLIGTAALIPSAFAEFRCSAAFSGPEAKSASGAVRARSREADHQLPSYLQEEIRDLARGFGLPARLEAMDGAGACVNADDDIVLIGRGLSARILSTMKRQLAGPMKKNPNFADRDS